MSHWNKSCHTWVSRAAHERVLSHMQESCHFCCHFWSATEFLSADLVLNTSTHAATDMYRHVVDTRTHDVVHTHLRMRQSIQIQTWRPYVNSDMNLLFGWLDDGCSTRVWICVYDMHLRTWACACVCLYLCLCLCLAVSLTVSNMFALSDMPSARTAYGGNTLHSEQGHASGGESFLFMIVNELEQRTFQWKKLQTKE